MTTFAPCWAKRRAVARPIPRGDAAPVMMQILSDNSIEPPPWRVASKRKHVETVPQEWRESFTVTQPDNPDAEDVRCLFSRPQLLSRAPKARVPSISVLYYSKPYHVI